MRLRRLLLAEDPTTDEVRQTLRGTYKKRVQELLARAVSLESVFGPFDEIFHNLTVPANTHSENYGLYEALLTIESYYHHSQAGRGALATALLRKLGTPQLIEAETPLRKLPEKLGQGHVEIVENETTKVKFDLVVKHGARLVLGEIKMKVYSGCTAGRVEMMRKFKKVVEVLIDSQYEQFVNALYQAGIREILMVGGILYDIAGNPATVQADREWF